MPDVIYINNSQIKEEWRGVDWGRSACQVLAFNIKKWERIYHNAANANATL